MHQPITIIITDDKKDFRRGIRLALEDHGIATIAEAGNGLELLAALTTLNPDVVLLDLEMDGMDGNETMYRLSVEYPAIKVVILSFYDDPLVMEDYLRRGAKAFFTKDKAAGSVEELADAIAKAHKGGTYINFERSSQNVALTPTQKEIIHHYASGRTKKEIAQQLRVTPDAVEKQKKKLITLLRIKSGDKFLGSIFRRGLHFLGPLWNGKKSA